MSLINKMLQELDARRSDATGAAPFGQQIRAVPEKRRIHPAWWVATSLAVVLVGVVAWVLLRPAAQPKAGPLPLPLKLDADLNNQQPVVAPKAGIAGNSATVGTLPPAKVAVNEVAPVAAAKLSDKEPEISLPTSIPSAPVESRGKVRINDNEAPVASHAKEPKAGKPAREVRETRTSDEPDVSVSASESQLAATSPTRTPTEPVAPAAIRKQVKELSPQQRAENEYRKAMQAMQQGRGSEALSGLENALQLDATHAAARQALIGLLIEQKRQDEALRWAREGVQLDVSQYGLAMILARLQVEKGELQPAIEILERSLPYAADRADYLAFLAVLLQRDDRHKQAAEHFLRALQRAPQNGVWWMGLGISLQADRRTAEAVEAFKRAKATNTLSPALLAFVDARLAQLQR